MPSIPILDVFRSDRFSLSSLSTLVDNTYPFQPSLLRQMNLTIDEPINSSVFSYDRESGAISIIGSSPRNTYGSPAPSATTTRVNQSFVVPRVYSYDTIYASSLAGARMSGSVSLKTAEEEVNKRLNGPTGLRQKLALTWENHLLGMVQGKVLDADGTTELLNAYTLTGLSEQTEIAFDLTNASPARGALKAKMAEVKRKVINALGGNIEPAKKNSVVQTPMGLALNNFRLVFLCGDNFYDALVSHPEVTDYVKRSSYTNIASALTDGWGMPYESLTYEGCVFINYLGGGGISIDTDKCIAFPTGVPGLYRRVISPADEFIPYLGDQGRPEYVNIVTDTERNAWVMVELYSYTIPFCTKPNALIKGRKGS